MNEYNLKKCFVSYSRKDVDIVRPIVQIIRAIGADVFRDEDSISPGKRWRLVINEALADADVVVVFWGSNSVDSVEVKAEYQEAIRMGKKSFL